MKVDGSQLGLEKWLHNHIRHNIISDILQLPQYADVTLPSPQHTRISQSIAAQKAYNRHSPANFETLRTFEMISLSHTAICLHRCNSSPYVTSFYIF
jgi:hypothetical protein